MFTFERNKTMFGKTDKRFPVKALLGTDILAYGINKSEAEYAAWQIVQDRYFASHSPMVIRRAKDGTVYCARWTSATQMEYTISRPGSPDSYAMGRCAHQSLNSYMDKVVADYDAVSEVL